ncbi:MAG: 23S rRNA (adenine(2503)-C(2))-methyltransferase RlmN [Deltaproteobacteria bacterium]|nr:23S rRNA (adenine(2503)-C(2))-methyltransferase RlmN [Deltaproteobacteria bacterium]
MIDILDLTYAELREFISGDLAEKPFRADQVWQWLWQRGVTSFEAMSNVSGELRRHLDAGCFIFRPEMVQRCDSVDGTIKLLLRMSDGELVETVLIPGEARAGERRVTQCLSSQVGCAMGCTFCSTGAMGFTRNLTQSEILGQVLLGREILGDTRKREILRNLVFMGMGEPLLNYRAVMRSLETLSSEAGLNFSRRRITVSTCGIEQGLLELGESGLAYLAISLHAPDQALRARIMPGAARWPLEQMLRALEGYSLGARERITFEYLLLGGVNDAPAQALALARIANRLGAKVNLIAYNPAAGSPYRAPTPERLLAFEQELWKHGVTAILRKSKGQDIDAACGQLKTACLADKA